SGLRVAEKNLFEEFQADGWAHVALVDRAKQSGWDEEHIAAALGGIAIALGTGFLVECARHKHKMPYDSTHPPASERLYFSEILFEVLEVHDQAYIARRFRELRGLLQGVLPRSKASPAVEP